MSEPHQFRESPYEVLGMKEEAGRRATAKR
jgi:hypothetical protein